VVSNVIGGGIFFVPVLVAQLVPDGRALLVVWAAGGALAFTGAMAYAELAALRRAPAASTCICARPMVRSRPF
jgi:APA family basic amino acid/polyamine antiporter